MFYLFHLFRSFLPLHNPIGFGATDFIELAIAVMLLSFALAWQVWIEHVRRFASRTGWCMSFLFLLPIALRLALLSAHPIPSPSVSDDFSYLLLGDTLSHFRLANPPHPLHQFFETFFVLQEPTYSSVYPMGQGIALALGKMIFGHPWAGVAVSIGAFCSLCYWMLRAWTTPGWSLLGGVLAAIEFGPLNQWMNSYWGGAVSAIAGCLVFGALPRLRDYGRTRDAVWLGLGLGIQLLARPFESIFLLISVAIFCVPRLRHLRRPALFELLVAALIVTPAIGLTLLQNQRVTGSWTTLPYALSRYQYGIPATFTVQPNPTPHRELTREQHLDYEIQSSVHGANTDTIRTYFDRLLSRVRFYRFFFLAPLYLALPAFLPALRQPRFLWVVSTIVLFALGSNLYPYFYSHYIAAVACLFVLISVVALDQLSRITIRGHAAGVDAARIIVFLCIAHFTFWYGLNLFGKQDFAVAAWRFETWDAINTGDPEGRIAINRQLRETKGDHLVFVRYGPQHTFKEWVHNPADIDRARIVWARDLGPIDNQQLRHYYSTRTAWLLQPDAHPLQLIPYSQPEPEPPPLEPARPAPNNPSRPRPHLKFEEVH